MIRAVHMAAAFKGASVLQTRNRGSSEHCLTLHLMTAQLRDWSASVHDLLWSALQWLCQPMVAPHIPYIASCSCCMLMVPAASAAHGLPCSCSAAWLYRSSRN
jgi:hypothetical protein